MLIWKSVEVTEFRTFAHHRVEFEPEGLTTVVGPNGAGKSSLVSVALLYALYGKAPAGVANKDLRRRGADPNVATNVTVTLLADGQEVVVSRSMKGKNLTPMAEITVNGEVVTDTKATAASDFVESLLGPVEAFSTVFLVQQKSLDALVQAKGAERRKLIERLAGVERLQRAVDEARVREREAKAAVAAVAVGDVDEADALVAVAADAAAAAQASFTVADTALAESTASLAASRANVTGEETKAREVLGRRLQWQELQSAHTQTTEHLKNAEAAFAKAAALPRENVTVDGIVTDLAPELARAQELRDTRTRLQEQISSLPDTADDAAVQRLRTVLESTGAHTLDDWSLLSPETAEEDAANARAQAAHLTGQLEGLSETCPTCGQSVDTARIRADLTNQLTTATERAMAAETELANVRDVNSCLQLATDMQRALTDADNTYREQSERVARKKQALTVLADTEQALTDQEHNIATLEAHNTRILELLTARDAATENTAIYLEAETAVHAARDAAAEAMAALLAFGPEPIHDTTTLDAATSAATAAETHHQDTKNTWDAAHAHLTTANDTLTRAQATADAARASKTAAEKARDAHRIAGTVRATMEGFRAERLASLAPALQESASDHINTLSGGRFTAIELSDDFEPTLIESSGQSRNVWMLSGGEESLVALALRLAVGDEIADGANGSLLVLDEILGAMDESRRTLIVDALRRLDRQTIMVDHHGTPGDATIHVQ